MSDDPDSGGDLQLLRGGHKRRVTLDDVAELAGVSRMTASRAMNNAKYVSKDAHRRVWEASEALGFVPHHGARSLATNRAGSVALIAPMTDDRFFSDPNVAPVIAGANAALSERGTQMVVLIAGNDSQIERIGSYVKAQHVDGAIVVSPEIIRPMIEAFVQSELPIAGLSTLGHKLGFDSVVVDSVSAVDAMVRLLVDAGCANIGMVAGPIDGPATAEQIAAYTAVVGANRTVVEYGDFSEASGRIAALRIFERAPHLDGIFAANDVMALGVLRALLEHGKRVPEDVRVGGFDDSSAARNAIPSLTTVAVPFEQMGRTMAELVMERINDPSLPPRHIVLPTQVIRRESA